MTKERARKKWRFSIDKHETLPTRIEELSFASQIWSGLVTVSDLEREQIIARMANWEVAAERDDVNRYFYHFSDVSAIENGRAFGIIGHKGEGKTAVAEWINNVKQPGRIGLSKKLTLREYPYVNLYDFIDSNRTFPYQYQTIWEYAIISSALRMLKLDKDVDAQHIYQLEKKFPREFDQDFYVRDFSLKDIFKRGLQVEALDVGMTIGNEKPANIAEMLRHYAYVIEEASIELRRVGSGKPYYVVFDELDEQFNDIGTNKVNRKKYFDLMVGLIRATENINRIFSDSRALIRPIFVLRKDIYKRIYLNDKNKMRGQVKDISWNSPRLKRLLAHRISKSCERMYASGETMNFETACLAIMDKRDLDRRSFSIDDIFEFVKARSFMRPRDIIYYFALVCERVCDRGTHTISFKDFVEVEEDYSNYLRGEVDDTCGGLDPDYIDIISSLGELQSTEIEVGVLSQHIRSFCADTNLAHQRPERIIEVLYEANVLGVQVNGHYHYAYMHHKMGAVATLGSMQIHRGLWRQFGLDEARH